MIVAVTWCALIAKRSYTVDACSGCKIRGGTSLHPCNNAAHLALPLRPTFRKFASKFLLHAQKSHHREICHLRCVMTFPVGLRLFMSVAIDQRKYVKFGFTKFNVKPLSDLRGKQRATKILAVFICACCLCFFVAWCKEVGDKNTQGQQMWVLSLFIHVVMWKPHMVICIAAHTKRKGELKEGTKGLV